MYINSKLIINHCTIRTQATTMMMMALMHLDPSEVFLKPQVNKINASNLSDKPKCQWEPQSTHNAATAMTHPFGEQDMNPSHSAKARTS